jgi:hypothetical protein
MSNQEAMQQLADKFMNDAEFRDQMRQDPEGERRSERASRWTKRTGKL